MLSIPDLVVSNRDFKPETVADGARPGFAAPHDVFTGDNGFARSGPRVKLRGKRIRCFPTCNSDRKALFMAHLDKTFASFDTFLQSAQAAYAVNLTALNSSGVSGDAVIAVGNVEEGGEQYVNVAIVADSMEAGMGVPQHIHGRFDDEGNPMDSVSPDIFSDTDRDGMVEVLEGVGSYGDVLLPLSEDGGLPVTGDDGQFVYIQSFDLNDAANFFSPVTMTDYTGEDILPLNLREIVLHGVTVPEGIGAGTEGEVDGSGGFTQLLPAASGEIEAMSIEGARGLLEQMRASTGKTLVADEGGDEVNGGEGDDLVLGASGDDTLSGGSGHDDVSGGAGNDRISGGMGSDVLAGNGGNDIIAGNGGGDALFGGDGDDFLNGGFGFDRLNGGGGSDTFFNMGVEGHATDWVQDFSGEEDMLQFGASGATRDDFRVDYAITAGAGDDAAAEAFVTHVPSGQVLWALVDGAAETSIMLHSGGDSFDLLA